MGDISTMAFELTTDDTNLNVTLQYLDYYDNKEVYQSPIGIMRLSLCAAGLVLNFLSIIAVAHIPQGITNHIKLILSLAVSDTLIILSVLFHYLHQLLPIKPVCMTLWGRQILNMSILATLLNLLAMAVDHYIAIMKPLRYPQIMTSFRGNCMIFLMWFISMLVGSLDYLVAVFTHHTDDDHSLCERASFDEFDSELPILGFVLVVFIIMITVYTRIYLVVLKLVKRHRTLSQDETHSYKAIVTTFLILGTFILCWIPHCIYQIVMNTFLYTNTDFLITHRATLDLVNDVLFLLLLSNSLCDPIIYAVRLGQVQNGYKRILFKYFPRYRRSLNEQEFRNLNSSIRGQRRCTSATLLDNEMSENCKRHHKISDTEITVIPLQTDYMADTNTETEAIKLVNYSQKDIFQNLDDWKESGLNTAASEYNSSIENTENAKSEKQNRGGPGDKEEDAKSSNTNVTPVSPLSDKDLWSDTEVSNLLNSSPAK